MDGRLSAGLPEVFAGSAQWATTAASFANVTPPEIGSVWPSAAAVGAMHGVVASSHAQFGARLSQTAGGAQNAVISYAVMDAEQNAQALADVIGRLSS